MQAAAIVENPSQRRLTDMRTLTAGVPDRRAQDPLWAQRRRIEKRQPDTCPSRLVLQCRRLLHPSDARGEVSGADIATLQIPPQLLAAST